MRNIYTENHCAAHTSRIMVHSFAEKTRKTEWFSGSVRPKAPFPSAPDRHPMPIVPLQSLAKIRMGVTLRGRDATRPDPKGSCRIIQIGDIADDGSFRNRDFTRIEPNEPFDNSLFLRPGDVLFPNRGLRTTAAVFDCEDSRII